MQTVSSWTIRTLLLSGVLAAAGCKPQSQQTSTAASATAAADSQATAADSLAEGRALYLSGDDAAALERLDAAIRLNSRQVEAYSLRAKVYSRVGKHAAALADLAKVIELEPGKAEHYLERAQSYGTMGDTVAAMADCNRALELEPEELPGAYSFRASLQLQRGANQLALADAEEAIRRLPTLAAAFNNRGVAYQRLGQLPAAIDDYTRAVDLNKQFAEAFNNRGSVYVSLRDTPLALQDFTAALHLKPEYETALENRATLLLKNNAADDASEDLTRLIEVLSANARRMGHSNGGTAEARAHANRAVARLMQRDFEAGLADCAEALRIDPSYLHAERVRAQIQAASDAAEARTTP